MPENLLDQQYAYLDDDHRLKFAQILDEMADVQDRRTLYARQSLESLQHLCEAYKQVYFQTIVAGLGTPAGVYDRLIEIQWAIKELKAGPLCSARALPLRHKPILTRQYNTLDFSERLVFRAHFEAASHEDKKKIFADQRLSGLHRLLTSYQQTRLENSNDKKSFFEKRNHIHQIIEEIKKAIHDKQVARCKILRREKDSLVIQEETEEELLEELSYPVP